MRFECGFIALAELSELSGFTSRQRAQLSSLPYTVGSSCTNLSLGDFQ